MEDKVAITCRVQDVVLVEKVLPEVISQFHAETKIDCKFLIDTVHHLPPECAGGVIVTCNGGKIKCDNTLESRMEHACEALLPQLRVRLFGPSTSRKFFD